MPLYMATLERVEGLTAEAVARRHLDQSYPTGNHVPLAHAGGAFVPLVIRYAAEGSAPRTSLMPHLMSRVDRVFDYSRRDHDRWGWRRCVQDRTS